MIACRCWLGKSTPLSSSMVFFVGCVRLTSTFEPSRRASPSTASTTSWFRVVCELKL